MGEGFKRKISKSFDEQYGFHFNKSKNTKPLGFVLSVEVKDEWSKCVEKRPLHNVYSK